MRIALLTDGIFPYVIGGMQKHSYYLARYMARKGAHVDLYHTNRSDHDIQKLEFFTAEEKRNIHSFVIDFPHYPSFPGHYLAESYEYSKKIFECFKENSAKCDFVYAKGFTPWELLRQKALGFRCCPVGVNFHGYEMFQKPASVRSWLEQLMLRRPVKYIVSRADAVFSYGGKITPLIRSLKVESEKIIEMPSGVEEGWLVKAPLYPSGIRKFIFVGRYERRKGIQELTDALRQIMQDHEFEFEFVGPIPPGQQLHSAKVKYWGRINDKETLKAIVKENHILVAPSHSEGMPNVILEAMALGKAIIATDVGAVSTLVSGNNGWLLPDPAVENIKNALIQGIEIPAEELYQKQLSSLAFANTNFSWDKIVDRTLGKIREFIDH